MKKDNALKLLDVQSHQSFTRPPPRFTEASLVKELEKSGIGRPSTYAAIMNKIQSRDYTVKEKGTLKPTELGKVIAQMLEDNFKMIMDIRFTAAMEDELELIAENKMNWKEIIRVFWKDFIPVVEVAEKEAFVPKLHDRHRLPECGHKLQKIWSRKKYFYGCSNYPDCKYTAPMEALDFKKEDYDPNFDWDQTCPKVRQPHEAPLWQVWPLPRMFQLSRMQRHRQHPQEGRDPCRRNALLPRHRLRRTTRPKALPLSAKRSSPAPISPTAMSSSTPRRPREKYPNHPKTPYVKKKGRCGKKKAENAEKKNASKKSQRKAPKAKKLKPAHALSRTSAVVEETHLSRPEVTKKLWDYIKPTTFKTPRTSG